MNSKKPAIAQGLTVIVPTCNPRDGLLSALMGALVKQSLSPQAWELIIVDNASSPAINPIFDPLTTLGVKCKVIRENKLGLTFARLAGFAEAERELIVMLDDDNLPATDFLAHAQTYANAAPSVGTFGGRIFPRYEIAPPSWFAATGITLGCRDLGRERKIARANSHLKAYPPCSPIGAGMVLRREVADLYAEHVSRQQHPITDRQGGKLSSGGDCEIVLVGLFNGWDTAYTPDLNIEHLIPASRLAPNYLARLSRESSRSWVLLLDRFNINPWPRIPKITVPLRKLKAWFVARAWSGPEHHIKWSGHCGIIEGRSQI